MIRTRGNAVPETALTVSFTLLVLYGVIQLATTAFYQVSADGASFVGAHDTVASVGNPTSANQSNAASAASVAFSKIVAKSISVVNPNSSTFETDVSQQIPGISALGNPQALTITSRLVEGTAGTASPSPLMNCTQSAFNVVNKANGTVISQASVGLLQANSLLSTVALGSGTGSALSLNTTALTNRVNLLNGTHTDLSNAVTDLTALPSAINAIPLVGTLLLPALSNAMQGPVADALAGTFSASSELAAVDAKLAVVPGVTSALINTVINPILTGVTGGTGILGSNGPLAALTADEKSLQSIDAGAAKCS